MNVSTIQIDTTPASYRFKSPGSNTVETFREDGGRWRIGLDHTEFDLTAHQARVIAAELIDAAAGADAMNRARFGSPKIDGREVIILKDPLRTERNKFADGLPRVVIRISSTEDKPAEEPHHCVRDSLDRDMTVTTRHDGYGKHKYTLTYTPVGLFELVLTDAEAGCILLARVEDES